MDPTEELRDRCLRWLRKRERRAMLGNEYIKLRPVR
jgi:hypothetical protein